MRKKCRWLQIVVFNPTLAGFFVTGMKGRLGFIMKIILFFFVISSVFSQEIDPQAIDTEKLRIALVNASRNSQRVIVEDFTGTL